MKIRTFITEDFSNMTSTRKQLIDTLARKSKGNKGNGNFTSKTKQRKRKKQGLGTRN